MTDSDRFEIEMLEERVDALRVANDILRAERDAAIDAAERMRHEVRDIRAQIDRVMIAASQGAEL